MMPSNHDSPLFDAGTNPRNRRFQLPGNAGLLLDFGEPPFPPRRGTGRVGAEPAPALDIRHLYARAGLLSLSKALVGRG